MLVLCRLKGTGNDGDSYRSNFPTYRMVAHDTASMLGIIDVPESDVPEGVRTTPFNAPWVPDAPLQVVRAVGHNLSQWGQLIRRRYQEGHSQWNAEEEVG